LVDLAAAAPLLASRARSLALLVLLSCASASAFAQPDPCSWPGSDCASQTCTEQFDPDIAAARWPVSNSATVRDKITEAFGPRDKNKKPTVLRWDYHEGVDIRARFEPLYAPWDGNVHDIRRPCCASPAPDACRSQEHWVKLEHQDGDQVFYTFYDHLEPDDHLCDLSIDDSLTAGDRFATSGQTAARGNPHLHFATMVGGDTPRDHAVNPMRLNGLRYAHEDPPAVLVRGFRDELVDGETREVLEFWVRSRATPGCTTECDDQLHLNTVRVLYPALFDYVVIDFDRRRNDDSRVAGGGGLDEAGEAQEGNEDGTVRTRTHLNEEVVIKIEPEYFSNRNDTTQTVFFRITVPESWKALPSWREQILISSCSSWKVWEGALECPEHCGSAWTSVDSPDCGPPGARAATPGQCQAVEIVSPGDGATLSSRHEHPVEVFAGVAGAGPVDAVAVEVQGPESQSLEDPDGRSPWIFPWTPSSEGTYTVTATGFVAGQAVADSAITVTVERDLVEPDVAIVGPSDGATLAPGWIPVRIEATDDDGISSVEVEVVENGNIIQVLPTIFLANDTWEASWAVAHDGLFSLRARARDWDGLQSTAGIQVSVAGQLADCASTNLLAQVTGPQDALLTWSMAQDAVSYAVSYREADSETWNSIGGLTGNQHALTGLTSCTSYEWVVVSTCSIGTASSPASTFFVPGTACQVDYCSSRGLDSSVDHIDRVRVGGFNRTSGDDGGYGDHTSSVISLRRGDAFTVQAWKGTSNNCGQESARAWIDFDHDGLFDDEEEIYSAVRQCPGRDFWPGTAVVPTTAFTLQGGDTRLRISMKRDPIQGAVPPQSCETFELGEVEDYTVRIDPSPTPPSCNQPTSLTASEVLPAELSIATWQHAVGGESYDLRARSLLDGRDRFVLAIPPLPPPFTGTAYNMTSDLDRCTPYYDVSLRSSCSVDGQLGRSEWVTARLMRTEKSSCHCIPWGLCTNSGTGGCGWDIESVTVNGRFFKKAEWHGTPNYTGFFGANGPDFVLDQATDNEIVARAVSQPGHFAVYVDWNRDGDFDDTDELFVSPSGAIITLVRVRQVPAWVSAGKDYRMRVLFRRSNTPASMAPCSVVGQGEIEDYSIDVTGPEICNDLIDNDLDDAVDCSDSDCAASPSCPPRPPEDAIAVAQTATQVLVTWGHDGVNVDHFRVERRTLPNGSFEFGDDVLGILNLDFDRTVEPETAYAYRVRAENDAGHSAWSNIATVTTPARHPEVPAAPGSLVATATGPRRVELSWEDRSDNELWFFVERKPGVGPGVFDEVRVAFRDATAIADIVEPEATYTYRLRAGNTFGESPYSNEAVVTTPPPGPPGPPRNLRVTDFVIEPLGLKKWRCQYDIRWNHPESDPGGQGMTYELCHEQISPPGPGASCTQLPEGTLEFYHSVIFGRPEGGSTRYTVTSIRDGATRGESAALPVYCGQD
jgi:hypothetical protein